MESGEASEFHIHADGGPGPRKPSLGAERHPLDIHRHHRRGFWFPSGCGNMGGRYFSRGLESRHPGYKKMWHLTTVPVQRGNLRTGTGMSWPSSFSAFGGPSLPCLLLLRQLCCPSHRSMAFSAHPVFGLQTSHHLTGPVSLYPRRETLIGPS